MDFEEVGNLTEIEGRTAGEKSLRRPNVRARHKFDFGDEPNRLPNESTDMGTDVVRPQNDGEKTVPEMQVQVADGEEPCGTPHAARECVLFNLDSLRMLCAGSGFHVALRGRWLHVRAASGALRALLEAL